MKNLLDSTRIATISLDNNLCGEPLTTEATRLIT